MLGHNPLPGEDYAKFAEFVRGLLIKRLSSGDGARFAFVCLDALVRDNKLTELLHDKGDPVAG
jgi:hypothetical protein